MRPPPSHFRRHSPSGYEESRIALRHSALRRRLIFLSVLLFSGSHGLTTLQAQTSSRIEGIVYLRASGEAVPLPRVRVTATLPNGGPVVAVAKTDHKGRYQLVGLPYRRIKISAARTGFFTQLIAGRRKSSVLIDCGMDGACPPIDFELARAGIVAGQVMDEYGEPLQRMEVSLRGTAGGATVSSRSSLRGHTDDRGRFRIFGIPPGDYKLRAVESVISDLHGRSYESDSIAIELEEGGEVEGVQVVMRRIRKFRVSGTVQGIDMAHRTAARILAIPTEGSVVGADQSATLKDGSRFAFWNLPEGSYAFTLSAPPEPDAALPRRTLRLRTLNVDREIQGLVLTAPKPTIVTGVMLLDTGVAKTPVTLILTAEDQGGAARFIRAAPPRYEFNLKDVLPGYYSVSRFSRGFYVQGIRRGEQLVPPNAIQVTEGAKEHLEIVLRSDYGQVSGWLKEPGAPVGGRVASASHYRVALAGADRIRSFEADQNGRFQFDKVVPGDYRICAWRDVSEKVVRDESLWKQSGCVVRAFPVEPNSEIEVDLTAAM